MYADRGKTMCKKAYERFINATPENDDDMNGKQRFWKKFYRAEASEWNSRRQRYNVLMYSLELNGKKLSSRGT
uniref:Transposase n=1 Tax=Syphacia muris TaxID=451379 RepID=A0A0N5AWS1_9BILA